MLRTRSGLPASAALVGLACLLSAGSVAAQQGSKAAQTTAKLRAADPPLSYQRHVETLGAAAADVGLGTRKAYVAVLGSRGPSIAVAGLKIPPTTFNVPMPRARIRAAFDVSQVAGTKCLVAIGVQRSGAETGAMDGLPSAALSRPGPVALATSVLALRFDVAYEARAQVGCVVFAPDGAIHAAAATITELRWEPQ